jgi:hypothetical protein
LAHVVLNKDLGRKQGRRKLGSNSSLWLFRKCQKNRQIWLSSKSLFFSFFTLPMRPTLQLLHKAPPIPRFFKDSDMSLNHVSITPHLSVLWYSLLECCLWLIPWFSFYFEDKSSLYIANSYAAPKVEPTNYDILNNSPFMWIGLNKKDAEELRHWVRSDFERYRNERDLVGDLPTIMKRESG